MAAFDDRVALITGASSGIGAALAHEFARRGADVALIGRRQDRLEAVAASVRRTGRRALVVRADVTKDGDLERAVERARDVLGAIHVVVANAGFGVVGRLDSLTLEDYRRQFETNVFGVLRTVYAALTEIKKTRGCFVLVGSVSGYIGLPGTSAYAMSKFAVRALAESLRYELAAAGVSVVLVSPGLIESELRRVDNRGVLRPEAPDPMPGWLRMSADRAAQKIVRAVSVRRRERVITGHGNVLVFLQRYAPGLTSAIIPRLGLRGRSEPS